MTKDTLTLWFFVAVVIFYPSVMVGQTSKPTCAEYWEADSVFIGTAKEKISAPLPYGAAVRFDVEKNFRGSSRRTVLTYIYLGSCEDRLLVGERYLVYAHRISNDGALELRSCSRTVTITDAGADLDYIRALNRTGHQSISGMILGLTREDLSRVKVVIIGPSYNLETNATELGTYESGRVAVGAYVVQLIFPFEVNSFAGPNLTVMRDGPKTVLRFNVWLEAKRCDYREISVVKVDKSRSGSIAGKVVEKSGIPFSEAFLYLCPTTLGSNFSYIDCEVAKADKAGEFEFVQIRPGQYYLSIGATRTAQNHLPRTFFPGVRDLRLAKPIIIGPNERVSLQPFVIPHS